MSQNELVLSHSATANAASSSACPVVSQASLFDAVFAMCDSEGRGRVRVSELIKYLVKITGADDQKLGELKDLQVDFAGRLRS